MGSHLKVLAKGAYTGFSIFQYNNSVVNLILQLLMFLTNRSPTVENVGQHGIRRQQWAPIKYDQVYKNNKNNNLTQFYFILTIMWSLPQVVGDNGIEDDKKYM
jgi:hypothetical protein